MADKEEHQSQRDKRLKKKKSGNPFGKNTPAGAAHKIANTEQGQANRNSKKKGPESRKKH